MDKQLEEYIRDLERAVVLFRSVALRCKQDEGFDEALMGHHQSNVQNCAIAVYEKVWRDQAD